MGFNVSWLAVRGKPAGSVLDLLRLKRTGEFEEVPESPVTGIALSYGWYVVFANDFGFIDRAPLSRLSESAEVVTCAVEEHVMASSASGLKDGAAIWSILHDPQEGMQHLKVSGEPPDEFDAIRARLFAEQSAAGGDDSDVDYVFDVPVEMALALTGFRHDEWIDGAKYERLK
jgi:hypothetical protein